MNQQWLTAGLAIFSVAIIVAWYGLTEPRLSGGWRQRLQGRYPGLVQLARFFYFVGLPYFAMISGRLTARSLGLRGLEHFDLVRLGGAEGWGNLSPERAALLMLLEWLVDLRALAIAGAVALAVLLILLLRLARAGAILAPAPHASLLDTLYDSLHWAFYRAIFWMLLADLYLALAAGAGLVLLEWFLIARIRRDPADRTRLPLQAIILILTSTIFYYSPNLFLLFPVHLMMVGMVRWVLPVEERAVRGHNNQSTVLSS